MQVSLTGIKPTGSVHLGNYVGAIKPAIDLQRSAQYTGYYFIADYHALIDLPESNELSANIFDIACVWLACGLDIAKSYLYVQSHIPEIYELQWILGCLCSKGLMNRAHAYKAKVDQNKKLGTASDQGINIGLYTYPVLMAADILISGADIVPIGQDQLQHLEIANDLVMRFDHLYNKNKDDVLKIPKPYFNKTQSTVMGCDGNKMSKSANNHFHLFCSANNLKKWISKLPSDSTLLGKSMNFSGSIVDLYKIFASEEQIKSFEKDFKNGLGWGNAKNKLFELLDENIKQKRTEYEKIKNDRAYVYKVLDDSKIHVRSAAVNVLSNVKKRLGLFF